LRVFSTGFLFCGRLAFFEEFPDEGCCAGGGAAVDFEAVLGGARGFEAAFGVAEELVDGFLEFA
jgi:hypothetical protein